MALLAVLVVGGIVIFRRSSTPPPPTIIANQIYVSQVSNTSLKFVSAEKVASQSTDGDLLDAKGGETFTTSDTGTGYAYFRFPGQVEVYLAGGSQLLIKDPTDERTRSDIVLIQGSLLVILPGTFPADQRFMVESAEGAQAWVTGSMMGAQYDPQKHELYVDCLQDHCAYTDNAGSQPLSQGSHVTLNGNRVVSGGLGTRNELWQFVRYIVAAPTLVPSPIPNLAATQACRYFTSLGLSCETGFPTATITPSPTPNLGATQTCRRDLSLGTPCP
jgi:hypothetical protein